MKVDTIHPTPEQIKAARLQKGHSYDEAAAIVHHTARSWQYWEKGGRRMNQALFDFYLASDAGLQK